MPKFKGIVIGEVEHDGDEAATLQQLQAAGCTNIMVAGRNYDAGGYDQDDTLVVGFEHPAQSIPELLTALGRHGVCV